MKRTGCKNCEGELKFEVLNGGREIIRCVDCGHWFPVTAPTGQFRPYTFVVSSKGNFLDNTCTTTTDDDTDYQLGHA